MKQFLVALLAMLVALSFSCTRPARTDTTATVASPSGRPSDEVEKRLTERLQMICDRADGRVGLSIVHIESGKTISINGQSQLPLYSVFKLPVAIAVLKEVEANRLKLDQKIQVTPADIVPGTPGNTALWQKPVEVTIATLIDVSIARSDNTSTDKLLQLVGGPQKVTELMRSMGFENLRIHSNTAEYVERRQNPNVGSADDLANLLTQLHNGKILQPSQQNLLIGFMQRTTTGLRRLRGDLPAGTLVADKTGSGERDVATGVAKATNDVGIITLGGGRGHLAMAVLVSDSSLTDAAQEKLIAQLARTAYDGYR